METRANFAKRDEKRMNEFCDRIAKKCGKTTYVINYL